MAGVVKGVQQQVVSSCPTSDGSQCDAFSTDHDNFSFATEVNTNNDLLALSPSSSSDNDLSLQDLIDSELALRISNNPATNGQAAESNVELLLDLDNNPEKQTTDVVSSPCASLEQEEEQSYNVTAMPVANGSLVADFLEQERSHTELVDNSQDNSLSLSLSSSNADMAPLCSGEGDDLDAESAEMASELGSEAPADSDFSPNVRLVEDEELEVDEATLAEDLSMASDRSQERTGSLLDLDPLRPDSPPGCGPGPGESAGQSNPDPGLDLSSLGTGDTGTEEGEGRPSPSPLEPGPSPALCSPWEKSGAVLPVPAAAASAAAAAVSQTKHTEQPQQQPEEEAEPSASIGASTDVVDDVLSATASSTCVTTDHVDGLLESSPNLPDPYVVANIVGVTSNGMDMLARPGPGAVAPGQVFEVGFETWSTVEEAVTKSDLLSDATIETHVEVELESEPLDSAGSDAETLSETSEKKSVTKKKKTSDGAELIKKKTKKTKKSEEKENISVLPNGHHINVYSDVMVDNISISNNGNNIPHDYVCADNALVEDDLSNVCVKDLKSAYTSLTKSEVSKDVKDLKEIDHDIIYCGPIKNLRRSFGDLRNCENSGNGEHFQQDEITSEAKSSFSKFDQLSKKTVLHVRSVDAAKVQKQFNESAASSPEAQSNCKACGKQVFVMEQIKAEKALWHKNCFRCKECSKQLTVDTYSSNEGDIFCKPHFRELFKPKAVVEDSPEPIRRRKPELIIRENQPMELPPDVVRASDKPDLGLEELSSLNVKSRFQVFEKSEESKSSEVEKSSSAVNVKRSASILSKLAKFQAKGMDIGVTDDSLNGIPYEESSTSSEEEEDEEENEENGDIIKSRRTARERPMSFSKMEDVKSRWETGSAAKKEERREERKQEIQSIRSRLFMGKQGKMKEMYEQAVKESEQPAARRGAEVRSEKAKSIKEKFERGETLVSDEDEEQAKKVKDEDLGVFEAGISKKSRSLFLELDASAAKTAQHTLSSRPAASKDTPKKREVHLNHQISSEVVKASDKVEDVQVETADISSRFKFFETYKAPEKQKRTFRITPPREGQLKMESPDREVYRDPDVVRGDDPVEGDELQHSMTTSKMLSIFRQMEEKAQREDVPDGPKPLKCFTPPPDYKPESDSSEDNRSDEEDEEEDEEDEEEDGVGVVRSSMKTEDEFLKAAKEAAKAKTLRAKFEHWEEQENNINSGGGNINPALLESEHESIESTRSLRARFEALKNEAEAPKEKPRPKVNRFVEIQTSCAEYCDSCEKKVYPLEKVETGGKLFHKGCFRCMQCSCILRMESYTLNNGKLYCIPHFKQLFISKGNYDEGFGLDQHKRKWNSTLRENGDILLNGVDANGNNH